MIKAAHPSTLISTADAATLREYAPLAEQAGMLHAGQLAIIHQQQWFKLLTPWVYSGLEKPLPAHIRLQEAISWADGSTGWVVTLCSGAGWFGGFINPALAQQIFSTPGLCLAGSGAQTGEAEVMEGGYRLNGTWNYASGAYHATHFTANCIIKRNGETVVDDNDKPWILPFIINKADVTLLPTWKYVGMVATGSNSFSIENLEVGEERCFHIDAAYAEVNSELYQYPFLQLAEATLAVNLSGMAVHFMDLCAGVFEDRKKKPHLTDAHKAELDRVLSASVAGIQMLRNNFFAAVDASWADPKSEAGLKAVSKTSRVLAIEARNVVDLLYPYCGLIAAAPDTEINRVWRDLHTASQHSLLTFAE